MAQRKGAGRGIDWMCTERVGVNRTNLRLTFGEGVCQIKQTRPNLIQSLKWCLAQVRLKQSPPHTHAKPAKLCTYSNFGGSIVRHSHVLR